MAIIWPSNILKPQSVSVDIAHRNLRSSAAANGFTQVVSNSAGVWRVSYDNIPVYSANMIKLWRALDTLAEGQLNAFTINTFDYPRSPNSKNDQGTNLRDFYNQSVNHSDTTPFDDGSGYSSTYTLVFSSSPALAGQVGISVLKAFAFDLEPGQRFSINDRLYQIQKVTAQTSTTATLVVRPPFRDDIATGDRLEFDNPVVRVRLMDDKAMFLPLNFNQQSFPPLEFIEDV